MPRAADLSILVDSCAVFRRRRVWLPRSTASATLYFGGVNPQRIHEALGARPGGFGLLLDWSLAPVRGRTRSRGTFYSAPGHGPPQPAGRRQRQQHLDGQRLELTTVSPSTMSGSSSSAGR